MKVSSCDAGDEPVGGKTAHGAMDHAETIRRRAQVSRAQRPSGEAARR